MKRLDEVLDTIAKGLADASTAAELRGLMGNLKECPRCGKLCDALFGKDGVCAVCYVALMRADHVSGDGAA